MQPATLDVARLPSGQLGVTLLAVSGQGAGIDGVGLAQCAERPDEGLDLAGIGPVSGMPGLTDGLKQGRLISSGRLANGKAGGVEHGDRAGERIGLIGPGVGLAGSAVEYDDIGLSDVASDEGGR